MGCEYICDCGTVAYADDVLGESDFSDVAAWAWEQWLSLSGAPVSSADSYPLFGRACGTPSLAIGALDVFNTQRTLGEFPLANLLSSYASDVHAVLGSPGIDWGAIQVRGYGYGRDAGLDWHRDGSVFAGNAIFYAHKHWNREWAGTLSVIPPCGRSFEIEPTPNRLVLMRGDQLHRVERWQGPENTARLTVNLAFLTRIGCFAIGEPWRSRR